MDVPFYFAFSAGIVAAFNPCGIAMFPAYIGFTFGKDRLSENILLALFRGLYLGLTLSLGFVIVFGIAGIILAFGGKFLGYSLPILGLGIGFIIAFSGVYLLLSKRNISIRVFDNLSLGNFDGLVQTFLFGIAYAMASLSCALPVFLAAVGIVVGSGLSLDSSANIIVGAIIYSLGMGSIMTVVTMSSLLFEEATTKFVNKLMPIIDQAGKIAMIFAGSYIMYYWLFGKGKEIFYLRIEQVFF
jgi:cytochrome c biogenesis protein CcdA